MPWTQTDLDTLDAAYKTGAEMVRLADGRTHQLRSIEEYRELRGMMVAEIGQAAGQTSSRLLRVGHASGIQTK